jgi:1-acyl-sn-glycerol-3-phosphate acyltransferase
VSLASGIAQRLLPRSVRATMAEVDDRLAKIPTRLNEFGFDPFGFDPDFGRSLMLAMVYVYRHWFRVEARGVANVPAGRVLLVGNHAGNTFAWDGAMTALALFLLGDPPRIARGMAEYFLSTIPFFNVYMQRFGSVVGTPGNCTQLLEHEEAILVFPEGQRGFVKTLRQRYQLQEFGLGFMRLALATQTPIVPIGIVGGEEQSPGLANVRSVGKLIGSPAFPITLTFPLLGPAGFVPLPVKYRIEFGEPLLFTGDPGDDDAAIGEKVAVVKSTIERLVHAGLARRHGWFA